MLYAARHDVRRFARERSSTGLSRFLQGARTMGKGAVAPAIALAALSASLVTRDPREKETATLILESAALSSIAAGVGQTLLASERPEAGSAVRFLRPGGHGVSGDAALAASIVWPLRCQYLRPGPGDGRTRRALKSTATALLYTGAALTAYQRIDQDKHWAPDAFLGMMAGLSTGRALCELHGARQGAAGLPAARRGAGRWAITPIAGGFAVTLRLDRRRVDPGPAH